MTLSRLIEHLAKERESLEDICLVDTGEAARPAAFLAALGEVEGKLEQPFRGLARDHQRLASILVGDNALPHRGEQAFGRLPDDDEVDAALVSPDDRARYARDQPRRTDTGIEIEVKAQFDLRHDLGV